MTKIVGILTAIALNSTFTRPLAAATVAYDNADDVAYQEGWRDGANGGYGWGSGWILDTSGDGGSFSVDGSLMLGSNSSDTYVTATRAFNGALSVGQTFSMDYLSSKLDSGAKSGIRLENSSGDMLFEFRYTGGWVPYTTTSAGGSGAKSATVSTLGVHLEFTLIHPEGAPQGVTRLIYSVTYLGDSSPSFQSSNQRLIPSLNGLDIAQFTIFLEDDSSNGNILLQGFDNFAVIPEPSTLSLLVGTMGLLGIAAWRRNTLN